MKILNINENANIDLACIGSALLDFIVEVDDAFLEELNLVKGEMALIDISQSKEILKQIEKYDITIIPGGSSSNTAAGIKNFQGNSAFIGRVGDDKFGEIYLSKTNKIGVEANISIDSGSTGHAITFITPDAERSFATHLGAAMTLSEKDIDENLIKNSKILHLEGYLFEPENLYNASLKAMDMAKKYKIPVSIDLSDSGLITRIFDRFQDIIKNYADIVFVNDQEAEVFTGKEKMEEALNIIYHMTSLSVVKLGENGSLIKYNNEIIKIPPFSANLINTNGAGDIYAAGLLYGITNKYDIEKSGRLGSYAASLVVAESGARLNKIIDPEKI